MSVERSDLAPRGGIGTLAAMLATVLLAFLVVGGFLAALGGLREPTPRAPAPRPAPMLQASERHDRATVEARAIRNLRAGLPIEVAMRRTAAAGWDAQP